MKTAEEWSDDVTKLWSKFDWDEINFNQFKNYVKNYIEQAQKEAYHEGQSNPKIKQLEWEDDVLFTDIIVSDGFSLLFYMIDIIDNTLHIGDMSQSFNTLEEAKAFAQDDFEARIKKCLIIES